MIPADFIAEWRAQTRWATNEHVEQDLVLSRALVSIFQDPEISKALALRGGTALHKLHLSPPRRYSNDIDLVQLQPGPFGPIMDRLRERLDGWLGASRDRACGFSIDSSPKFRPSCRSSSRSRRTPASTSTYSAR